MAITIRDEEPDDIVDIHRVNLMAFGQPDEANLVDALRSNDAMTLSLVATDGSDIVGHILFSPVTVKSDEQSFEAVGLGPMAVRPDAQRRGIGSELVRAGLARLRASGHEVVVVLGHPEFYPRFGFRPASEFGIRWQHRAPDETFMVVELMPQSLAGRGGIVSFRREFDGL